MPALPDLPADRDAAIVALRACRREMIGVLRTVKPMAPVYHAASMVLAAIDAMAGVLTGDEAFFHTGGSVGPDRADAVKRRQREVEG